MKKKSKNSSIDIMSYILSIYVIAILGGMFLIYHDFYYDILETKYIYYCVCTSLMLVCASGYLLWTSRLKELFKHLKLIDIFVILWGIFIIISTVLSPEKKLAFLGTGQNTGRYTGCVLLLLYIMSYFYLTRYYKIHKWHVLIFLIASIIMCLLGIADFFNIDILHFKDEIKETQRHMFTSTIGNINTYTACVAMSMAVFGVLFVAEKDRKKLCGYGVGIIITYIALILGESDNAYLSLAAFFGILPFYLVRFKGGICRYCILMATFFTTIKGISLIENVMEQRLPPIHGLFQVIADYQYLEIMIVFMWIVALSAYFIEYKSHVVKDRQQTLIYIWAAFLLFLCIGAGFMIYEANNVISSTDRYDIIKDYLVFNDDWGTRRGYIWRIAVENYRKFPPLQKVFGYGPDTFGAVTMDNNYPEMVERYSEIFDSVHNEYLQYFITIGPFGLLSYLAIHIAAVVQVMKKKIDNPLAVGALLAVLCYAAQAMVNINQPIATPVMWTLLSISVSDS